MKFEGWFPPHPLQPTQYGLLSVARLTELVDKSKTLDQEERWVRGYSHMFETNPTINLLTNSGAQAHNINDATGSKRYLDVKPFFIEVEDFASTLTMTAEKRKEKIVRQLEAGTQKAAEHEFWHGYIARADGNGNQYLTNAATVNIVNSGNLLQLHEGLGFLEYAIAQSPIGEQGVIHMTRDIAAMLGSQWILERPEDSGQAHLETTNGTPVAIGSGYDGSGPKAPLYSVAVASNGVATVITSYPHGLTTDDLVSFSDVGDPLNPMHQVKKLDDVASYTVTGTPSPTTFTISVNTTDIPEFSARRVSGYAFFSPDQDHKWMYATGLVDVNLGEIQVINTEPGHGYDVEGNKNDIRLKAIRPVGVHHEPAVHYAVKVQVHQ